jgi:tetratricopeptide (TPR) repeat protein
VEFHAVGAEKELDKNVEEILALYEHLKTDKMNYYDLLGLEKTAGSKAIKDAYFSYAKKYHPDRISSAPDPEIKEKANFVFAEMNKAYETLSDNDKKRSYDSKGYKEESMEDTIQENLVERARMLYRKAKVLYTQKQHWEAVSLLDEAVRLDPGKASYFLLLGLCQMNIPTMKRMAEKNLQKATELESWNVEAFTALGVLFLTENQLNRAEGFLKKALAINPEHTLAKKKLAEITGRSNDKKKRGFSLFGKKK